MKRVTLEIEVPNPNNQSIDADENDNDNTPLTPSSKKLLKKSKFPIARIKKIMQKDEQIGKMSSSSPVLVSRCVELFIEDLLNETLKVTNSVKAKTMTNNHL
jgi:histone H3/H4